MNEYYYVGVSGFDINDDVLRYVYDIDSVTETAFWGTYKELRERNETPKSFSLEWAKDLSQSLNLNGYFAFVITTTIELK